MGPLRKIIDKIPFDKLIEFPSYQRWIVIVLVQVIIVAAYYFLIHSGKTVEITQLEGGIQSVKMEVAKLKKTSRRLPQLKKEMEAMVKELKRARAKLPNEKEIPKLLTDISNIGTLGGLDFVAFKPSAEVAEKYYARVPVNMTIRGTFHNMLNFFDQISKMPRIVSISNVKFMSPQKVGDKVILATTCIATTFRYLDKAEQEALAQIKKGKS